MAPSGHAGPPSRPHPRALRIPEPPLPYPGGHELPEGLDCDARPRPRQIEGQIGKRDVHPDGVAVASAANPADDLPVRVDRLSTPEDARRSVEHERHEPPLETPVPLAG